MPDQRAALAIRRIERALERIDTASRDRPASAPPAQDDSELRALKETHQALRRNVEGAIEQIDRLLIGESH